MTVLIKSNTFTSRPYKDRFKISCIRTRDVGNCYELTFRGKKANIEKMLAHHGEGIK